MRLIRALNLVLVVGGILLRKFATSTNQTTTPGEQADETLKLISENAQSSFTDDVILVLSPANCTTFGNASATLGSNPLQQDILTKSGIYPYLTSHPKTSVIFYDVSRTSKNASMDIATAFYIKNALNHARRVKIVLVFNYSLMISENRTHFATFLDNASNFIKNCSKYRPGIALIASQCKTSGYLARQHTVRRIGRVLQDMKKNGTSNRICVIDALLTRDMDGTFSHIGYFYKLDSDPQGSNTAIEVLYNIKYISKSGHDFGFSLSPGAKSILQALNQRATQRIASTYVNLGSEIQAHYEKFNFTSLTTTIGKLIKEYRSLTTLLSNLEKIHIRKNFTEVSVRTLTLTMKVNIDSEVIRSIRGDASLLDFLELFTPKSTGASLNDWLRSLSKSSDAVFARIVQLGNVLNNQMESALLNATKDMTKAYRSKLIQTGYSSVADERLWQDIHRDHERLSEMKSFIPSASTFNEFVNRILTTVLKLSVRNHELPLLMDAISPSSEDFTLSSVKGKSLSFNVYAWISPIDQLLTFLSIEQNLLDDRLRKWKQDEILTALRVSMQERCDRVVEEVKANFSARCERCV
ncbi:unnamed protein product [Allacma fusca]|uniref:Uncharacterized protein n=1 Tax=Allacma fusca TaxID=39272 RepID=A0A8J2NR18_9HEXA|nr:unnamed protein product [Allacma fusca]